MEMILILGFGALLIFFMMNSRKKQRQQQEKLSTGLVPGARVMTTFGVFGTVVDVMPEENKVTIEAGPGTVLTVHRQAIGSIEEPVEAPDAGLSEAGFAEADPSDRVDADLDATRVPDDLSSLTGDDAHERDSVGRDGQRESGDEAADDADGTADSADDAAAETDGSSTTASADDDAEDADDGDSRDGDSHGVDSDDDRR